MQTVPCQSCKRPMVYVESVASGKSIPLDAEPVANGNIVLVDGKARYLKKDETPPEGPRYVSHFATCPDAAKFRKKS